MTDKISGVAHQNEDDPPEADHAICDGSAGEEGYGPEFRVEATALLDEDGVGSPRTEGQLLDETV